MEALADPRRDPLTLRFADPALERAFQAEMAASSGPQARFGAAVAVGLWLAAAAHHPGRHRDRPRLRHRHLPGDGRGQPRGRRRLALGDDPRSAAVDRVRAQRTRRARGPRPHRGVRHERPVRGAGAAAHRDLRVRRHPAAVRVRAGRRRAHTWSGFAIVVLSRPSGGTALDLFLVSAAVLVGLGATYLLERGARDVFAQRRLIEAQAAELAEAHATSERLLLNILPEPVAERLKAGETTIADGYDGCHRAVRRPGRVHPARRRA